MTDGALAVADVAAGPMHWQAMMVIEGFCYLERVALIVTGCNPIVGLIADAEMDPGRRVGVHHAFVTVIYRAVLAHAFGSGSGSGSIASQTPCRKACPACRNRATSALWISIPFLR